MSTNATFLKRIMNALTDAREAAVRRRVRQQLRGMSDRQLDDMGFSRELLEQGHKAWPWRTPIEPHATSVLAAVMRGLNTDSPPQPADYGRGHHSIVQADPSSHSDTDEKLAA